MTPHSIVRLLGCWANSDSGIERSSEVEKIAEVKGLFGVDGVVLGVETRTSTYTWRRYPQESMWPGSQRG